MKYQPKKMKERNRGGGRIIKQIIKQKNDYNDISILFKCLSCERYSAKQYDGVTYFNPPKSKARQVLFPSYKIRN